MKINSKNDLKDILFKILDPLIPHYSSGGARLCPGNTAAWYDDLSAQTEGFSRPLWGLVPLWASGGDAGAFDDIYIRGIVSGTDKASAEYWGECRDRDQRFVEMAAIAYALIFSPDKVWYPLNDKQRSGLAEWLFQINGHEVCDSNWIFFRVLVNIALKKRDMKYSSETLRQDIRRIEDFYLGNGWYSDGPNGQKDYYISFAIHFYSLVYAMTMEDDDPERCAKYRSRAEIFAHDFIYWFADDGETLPYGRSLTYRFAQLAFWSACVAAGVLPFEKGIIKGIIERGLGKWLDNRDIFDNSGILTIGYKYPSLHMAEHYNAPGSPYWALKTFMLLMLDDNDPFWSCEALPMPELNEKRLIKNADMLIIRNQGDVYAYTAGTQNDLACGQIAAKYLKFAYSTVFGFNVMRSQLSLEECAPDNMLVFEMDGMIFIRRHNYGFTINDNEIITKWSPFKGIEVETKIIPFKEGHIREHTVYSEYECRAYECGYAAASRDSDMMDFRMRDGECTAYNSFSSSSVRSESNGSKARLIYASPNTNILFNKTVIPSLEFKIKQGKNIIKSVITAYKKGDGK